MNGEYIRFTAGPDYDNWQEVLHSGKVQADVDAGEEITVVPIGAVLFWWMHV